MVILGIDPGTTRIGYGLIEKNNGKITFRDAGMIETSDSGPGEKLLEIKKKLSDLLEKYNPDLVGVEKLFFSKNKKTAFRVSEARGVILALLAEKSVPFVEILPKEAKLSVTGSGNAGKDGVAKMVGYILNIPAGGYIDDTTDALAIAIAAGD